MKMYLLLDEPVPAPRSKRPTNMSGNMVSVPRKSEIEARANIKVPVVAIPVNSRAETERKTKFRYCIS